MRTSRRLGRCRLGAGHILAILMFFPGFMVRPAAAQEPSGTPLRLVTLAEVVGDTAFVRYELSGDPEASYHVCLSLRRTSDPGFVLPIANALGAVGRGRFAGGVQTIRWPFLKSFGAVLTGDDFIFEVTAEE
ncbi:MAG: hypothetical protein WB626_08550 [Bacteroidota bacterium]